MLCSFKVVIDASCVHCRPLHLSARHVDLPELTTLLLSSGAHVTSVNTSFLTPLSVACKANNPAVATQLIDKGNVCIIEQN